MSQIRPGDIDHDAARGLLDSSKTTGEPAGEDSPLNPNTQQTQPSYTSGSDTESNNVSNEENSQEADSPWQIMRDPTLVIFVTIIFFFHLANATVLPLVMQTLAVADGRTGILLSAMCIIIAQAFMVGSAKICGDYSGIYGRKTLFLIGLFALPVRCALLTFLLHIKENVADDGSKWVDILMLSTQVLDGVGAGVFGTMYVLVTSDISGGTGRFSLALGLTTSAVNIGGTISGYLGQAIAQDYGYNHAFSTIGYMALFPALLYLFVMPETLKKRVDEKTIT